MKTTTKEQIVSELETFFNENLNAEDLTVWMNEAILCVLRDNELTNKEKESIVSWLTANISPVIKELFLEVSETYSQDRIMYSTHSLFCNHYSRTALYLSDINRSFLNKYLIAAMGGKWEVWRFMRTQASLMVLLELYNDYEMCVDGPLKAEDNYLQTALIQ